MTIQKKPEGFGYGPPEPSRGTLFLWALACFVIAAGLLAWVALNITA